MSASPWEVVKVVLPVNVLPFTVPVSGGGQLKTSIRSLLTTTGSVAWVMVTLVVPLALL